MDFWMNFEHKFAFWRILHPKDDFLLGVSTWFRNRTRQAMEDGTSSPTCRCEAEHLVERVWFNFQGHLEVFFWSVLF